VDAERAKKLRRAIQNKRLGVLSRDVVFIHDNARPHKANATQQLLMEVGQEQSEHPPDGPDLLPSDFNLLLHMKSFLGGQMRDGDDEVNEGVTQHAIAITGCIFLR